MTGPISVRKHYVEFLSPGTFMPESSSHEIESWDVLKAVEMAKDVVERHNARPFGFRFKTRGRGPNDLDSRTLESSGIYYLGGKIQTREEVEARNDPNEEILRSNMRCNNVKRIVINENSWRFTAALNDGDIVLDVVLPPRREDSASTKNRLAEVRAM